MAIDAWVLRNAGPSSRAAVQIGQPQFHCGTPPPAAAPRTTTRNITRLRGNSWESSCQSKPPLPKEAATQRSRYSEEPLLRGAQTSRAARRSFRQLSSAFAKTSEVAAV